MKTIIRITCAILALGSIALAGVSSTSSTHSTITPDRSGSLWGS